MSVLGPEMYSVKSLPVFLTQASPSDVNTRDDYFQEGHRGPFGRIYDFGYTRQSFQDPVPHEERIQNNTRPDLRFLAFDMPEVRREMDHLSAIANDRKYSPNNPGDRLLYRTSLSVVYEALAENLKKQIGHDRPLIFPPKNGGIFVQEIFAPHFRRPLSNSFFDYRLSRLLHRDGRLMVGTQIGYGENMRRILNHQTYVVADDCIASDVSAWTTLEMIVSMLRAHGMSPQDRQVSIVVSAATQRGLTSLLSQETREYFGFGHMQAIAATPVYRLNDHYYLLHDGDERNPDGSFVVGDMGKWTMPID